jgi:GNAT superfamily N-acetyltransferase
MSTALQDVAARLLVRPAVAADFPLVERLFGPRGGCGGCWCMHWLAPPGAAAWQAMKGAANREALRRRLEAGECHALLAIDRDRPVGWCRLGPAGSFPRLLRSRKLARAGMADWAVVCFFVAPDRRGAGISAALLEGAVALARRAGAQSLEGYPVLPRGGEVPAPFAWTGLPGAFEAAGFARLRHDAGARAIYRLDLQCPDAMIMEEN